MKPDLLGYLLHNLEPTDERVVEEFLESHPDARRELAQLRRRLSPLDAWTVDEVPENLFFNTLRTVASQKRIEPAPLLETRAKPRSSAVLPLLEPWHPSETASLTGSRWRRADVWTAAAMLLVILLAVPPVLRFVRERANEIECRDNMRRTYPAFLEFADRNRGYLPALEMHGNLSHAGVYATILREANLWGGDMRLDCGQGSQIMPVSLAEVKNHDPNDHAWWTKFGGGYGYHLGYIEKNGQQVRLVAVRRADGDGIPILADRPPRMGESANWATANSPNHGGRGQNVMFNGGHVLFLTARHAVLGEDKDIYSNLQGLQAAGLAPHDAVIGPSEARPVPSGSQYSGD
jgi:hypothetical protein